MNAFTTAHHIASESVLLFVEAVRDGDLKSAGITLAVLNTLSGQRCSVRRHLVDLIAKAVLDITDRDHSLSETCDELLENGLDTEFLGEVVNRHAQLV